MQALVINHYFFLSLHKQSPEINSSNIYGVFQCIFYQFNIFCRFWSTSSEEIQAVPNKFYRYQGSHLYFSVNIHELLSFPVEGPPKCILIFRLNKRNLIQVLIRIVQYPRMVWNKLSKQLTFIGTVIGVEK